MLRRTTLICRLLVVMLAASALPLLTKTAIADQPAGWASRGPGGGGALFAPSFSPHNPNEIYLACDMSEVFHSTDLGASWETVDFRQIQGNRQSLVRFTNDPAIMYTLDYSFDQTTPTKSTDGGATWQPIATEPTDGGAYSLFADPNNANNLLVSDYTNLYFSSNGGASFSSKFADSNGCYVAGAFFDGANMYVGTSSGLLVSTNGGSTFALSSAGGIPSTQAMVSMAGAKQGSTVRLFAVTADPADVFPGLNVEGSYASYLGIYTIDSGQASWTQRTTGIAASDHPMFVAMSLNDISTAYVAGQNDGEYPIIYKTTNGGASWQAVFLATNNQNVATGWSGYRGDRDWSYGAGALGFAVSPTDSNRVAYTDLGFAHATTDGGASWRQMYVNPSDQNPAGAQTPKNRSYRGVGLEDTSCWWLTWADASTIFASYSDIRGTRSTDAGASWSFNFTGQPYNSTYQSVKHPVTGTIYVGTSSAHDIYQSTYLTDARLNTATGSILYSTDKGLNWATLHDFANPVICLAIDPNNTNRMYASVIDSVTGGIYVSNNIQNGAASTWTKLASPPRTEGHPFNIHVLNDGTLVCTYSGRRNSSGAFTASSGVFVSTDGGANWTDRSDAGMRYWTKDLVINPHDATQSTWYVDVYSGWGGPPNGLGGLYKTTNRGQSWTRINNLDRVGSCTINPGDPNEMYLTTEVNGLWHTNNLTAAMPTFTAVTTYPFRQPERVFYNPYNPGEVWVTSFGGGIRVGVAAPCSYSISPKENFIGETGGTANINVTASAGCAWQATTNSGWVSVNSPANGTGDGAVSYTVSANTTGMPRAATITIAGQTFTVTQDGGASQDCSYSISPVSKTIPASGGAATISVAAGPRCAWQAAPNVNWITITSATNGIGNGVVAYSVAPNTTGARRKGKITIAGLTYNIKQKP
jgi:Viral BACON domain/Putative binding domain, N-terminal